MIKFSRTQDVPIDIDGGSNTNSSILEVQPGMLIGCQNHCFSDPKGYERILGYERTDGRLPSDAKFTLLETTHTLDADHDVTVTGTPSGATGRLLFDYRQGYELLSDVDGEQMFDSNGEPLYVQSETSRCILFVTSGIFVVGDVLDDGTNDFATVIKVYAPGEGATSYNDETDWNYAAIEAQRGRIQRLPGDLDVTGAWQYNGKIYAFRNDSTHGSRMYVSSATGWQAVGLGEELKFDAGTSEILENETITGAGGATATVVKVMTLSGDWSANPASGVMVIKDRTGNFVDNEALTSSSGAATADGAEYAVTRDACEYMRFINYNFTGAADHMRMYGTDGVNQAFEFDGTTYARIYTGFEPRAPKHINVIKHTMFLSYHGSWAVSGVGNPFLPWTSVEGGDEFGMGDEIVGSYVTPSLTMISFCKESTDIIYGTSGNWTIKPYSNEVGAIENSIQGTFVPGFVSNGGIQLMTTTEKWGGFDLNNIDKYVQDIIVPLLDQLTTSTVFRQREEYRIYFGNCCIRTKFDGQDVRGFTTDMYDIPINNATAAVRAGAGHKDSVVFVSNTGYVYKMDSGYSFDGAPIVSYLFFPPFTAGSARRKKRWYSTVFEIDSSGKPPLYFKFSFDLFHPTRPDSWQDALQLELQGGRWDLSSWDRAYWASGGTDTFYKTRTGGTSAGLDVKVFSSNFKEPPYIIKEIIHRFAMRAGEI